jgi:type I restriction enzyme S subunit
VPLGDLVREDAPIGYGILQPGERRHDGIPVLAIHNLPDRFHLNLHRSSAAIEAAYARSRVRQGDVLLSIKGTTGRVGVVPGGFSGNISRDLARLRVREGVSPRFLAHVLRAPQTQRRLSQAKVGTTRDEISIGVLRSFLVPLPPLNEQELIADTLDAVDGSIRSETVKMAKLRSLHRSVAQHLLGPVVPEEG